jgi:hypothetical protein
MIEGVDDGRIAWPNRMKDVAGEHHNLGPDLDDPIDRTFEGPGDVRLPLVDPTGSEPLILPEAEVEVGEMKEAQAR